MTTTDPTANDVIAEELRIAYGYRHLPDLNATAVLDALTAAGYAVVRLPEPDLDDADHAKWFTDTEVVRIDARNPGVIRQHRSGVATTAVETRRLAAALLAAADHQEKNQ